MISIILIARDRPRLTRQSIESIRHHTCDDDYNLTVVDDGSIEPINVHSVNSVTLRVNQPTSRVGLLKNMGAWFSERNWGRGEYICFLDNDIYCDPNWLEMLRLACEAHTHVRILGGYRHPYHGVNEHFITPYSPEVECTDAVAGYCHFMRWNTWEKYGPYDSHAKGVCQSEDFSICRKVVDDGFKVGYLAQPVMWVCGITNTEGNPAIGSEGFHRRQGLVYL